MAISFNALTLQMTPKFVLQMSQFYSKVQLLLILLGKDILYNKKKQYCDYIIHLSDMIQEQKLLGLSQTPPSHVIFLIGGYNKIFKFYKMVPSKELDWLNSFN